MTATHDNDTLITAASAAKKLGVSLATLRRWRASGHGPAYLRLGPKRLRYRIGDLRQFLAGSTIEPASTAHVPPAASR